MRIVGYISCTMSLMISTGRVRSVIENMRMRDKHVDDVSLHTQIHTYIHTYIDRYSGFCYMLLLYSGLNQARSELYPTSTLLQVHVANSDVCTCGLFCLYSILCQQDFSRGACYHHSLASHTPNPWTNLRSHRLLLVKNVGQVRVYCIVGNFRWCTPL